ncbi:MAG: DUF3098 domain-containing protein [Bacteroidales bacterium]|nr:DUF3098 domain-containing protein [Bacteroidales bacterium]
MANQKQQQKPVKPSEINWVFSRENYIYMFIGLGLLTLGYLLMIGGGSDDIIRFSPSIFDFQRLTLAPLLVLAGYAVEIYAIMKLPKKTK